jgi:serine/threonine-protein kinase RsbW
MISSRARIGRREAVLAIPRHDPWQRQSLRSTAETAPVLEAVAAAMIAEAYLETDVFGMRLALEEALVNAVKHGHHYDPSKEVRVRYQVNAQRAVVQVEDEGPGFDPHQVADPLAPENLERSGGRGVFLMRYYMTWVRYNKKGTCLTLCKCRS